MCAKASTLKLTSMKDGIFPLSIFHRFLTRVCCRVRCFLNAFIILCTAESLHPLTFFKIIPVPKSLTKGIVVNKVTTDILINGKLTTIHFDKKQLYVMKLVINNSLHVTKLFSRGL